MTRLVCQALANHATDPAPISTTIRKCASEFKKVRYLVWRPKLTTLTCYLNRHIRSDTMQCSFQRSLQTNNCLTGYMAQGSVGIRRRPATKSLHYACGHVVLYVAARISLRRTHAHNRGPQTHDMMSRQERFQLLGSWNFVLPSEDAGGNDPRLGQRGSAR